MAKPKKFYFPGRVSRNERLAFQLVDDPKITIKDVERRRGSGKLKSQRLAEFVVRRRDGIHLF